MNRDIRQEELLSELEEARQAVINFDDTWDVHGRKRTCFYCFHPGHLLRMNMNDRNCESYVRWTDYETGEVCVSFEDEDGIWERRTFTSHTDNVTITEIKKSSKDSKIDMVIGIDDVSSMKKFGLRDENFMQYKKLVDEDGSYIAQSRSLSVIRRFRAEKRRLCRGHLCFEYWWN